SSGAGTGLDRSAMMRCARYGACHGSEFTPTLQKGVRRTGLQARLFKYEIVLDLVSADLTKCEIFKQPQKDIYAL
ncbi:MAG: hypothetical protein R6U98_34605, partial [Pirellulaceae bacterium]